MARVKLFINGVTKNALNVSLQKQGERAIDQIKMMLPANVSVEVNDRILWVQDFVDLGNLSAIYNFQASVKDESVNLNHGTETDIVNGADDWNGYSAIFNGTTTKVTIPDDNSIDLSGEFHIFISNRRSVLHENISFTVAQAPGGLGSGCLFPSVPDKLPPPRPHHAPAGGGGGVGGEEDEEGHAPPRAEKGARGKIASRPYRSWLMVHGYLILIVDWGLGHGSGDGDGVMGSVSWPQGNLSGPRARWGR